MKNKLSSDKYRMSFTTGGLFFNESLQVAELYEKTGNWLKNRNLVLSENILQARTESSAKRRVLAMDNPSWLLIFPISDADIQEVLSGQFSVCSNCTRDN